ncbi:MAG: phosphoribosylformylglycinamidine synthase subunit PurL [Planctomycetota bacterium]|nr:MAG: phosphoribosylformylglycinamidine synthase subunit PurL [Planctomycetota bacterium]
MPPSAAASPNAETAPGRPDWPDCPEAWRVEVFKRVEFDDPEGTHALAAIRELGIASVTRARLGRGFLLPPTLERDAVDRIAGELLADPVLDEARVTAPGEPPSVPGGVRRVLIARKPGVMDPVALTTARAIARTGLVSGTVADDAAELAVATFQAWELEGAPSDAEVDTIARRLLANEVIEDIHAGTEGLFYGRPQAGAAHGAVTVALRDASDAQLEELSAEGVLALNLTEMRAIQEHYRGLEREPTACELETLAQTWSEHCKHKTFRGLIEMDGELIDDLLMSTIARATHELDKDWCISVFHDNAGIVAFDEGWDLAFKVETHNHPSAIDPYGGAGTGIGGVIRDIMGVGLGAKPIANTDAFFVGPMELPPEDVPKGTMHPRRILRGVVAGVRDYGNRMGIPTLSGGVWFDEGYVANPLVFAGTVGLIPRDCATKSVEPGDVVLVVGGRTGRDGIHGATFSSVELHDESETVSAAAVQIGDPIMEKRVLDALLVARDRKLYRGITDCGAGGLSSAVGEMGEHCGAEVQLDQVPLKYPGLTPEEIWISEAQERMVLAVPPENLAECLAVFAAEDVEATPIGHFTDTKRLVLTAHGEIVGELDMQFLHDGTPRPTRQAEWRAPELADPGCPPADDHGATLLALLGCPNIASKEWIVRQYDHEVQGTSVVKPMVGARMDGPSDGAVIKPLPDSRKGAAIGCAASSRYGRLDPGAMAEAVIDEALRNVVATGGDPARTALLDNFAWGNCDKPEQLGALVLAAKGCYRAAMAYGTPFISGKDSLNNEYRVGDETLSIPPTLFVSALAIVPNVERAVTMDVKRSDDLIMLVGTTRGELGGSEYLAQRGLAGGTVPRPDLAKAPALFAKLHSAMRMGYVRACHDLSEGGLAVAAAEMSLAGGRGMDLDLAMIDHADWPAAYDEDATLLYSESCTRFLVEVEPGKKFPFQTKLMGHVCIPLGRVAKTDRLKIKGTDGGLVVDLQGDELRAAFQSGFQG